MPDESHGPGTLVATGGYCVELLLGAVICEATSGLDETLRSLDPTTRREGRVIEFADGVASAIEYTSATPTNDLATALTQTWDWPAAEQALEQVRSAVIVREMPGAIVSDRFERLRRFNVAVRALLEHAPVLAIHWVPAQRLVEPASFVHRLAHGSSVTDHAVNVRLFRVPDGAPGEAVMDTLGLAPFGIPDLQVHFAGLDPGDVSAVLLHYSDYVFDKGDVLDDEHLLRGIEAHEEWLCRRHHSLVPPLRPVVDIHSADHAVDH